MLEFTCCALGKSRFSKDDESRKSMGTTDISCCKDQRVLSLLILYINLFQFPLCTRNPSVQNSSNQPTMNFRDNLNVSSVQPFIVNKTIFIKKYQGWYNCNILFTDLAPDLVLCCPVESLVMYSKHTIETDSYIVGKGAVECIN